MGMKKSIFIIPLFFLSILFTHVVCQTPSFSVIGYYAGGPAQLDSFQIEKLTHIIFSFCHLKGNKLNVNNARDTLTIQKMVDLKKRNPGLKVLLSLGGWGGCETCSTIFSDRKDRKEFSRSVKELNHFFHVDGIDLDWEYPVIAGYPGHKYSPDDKDHFTALVKQLRKALGKKQLITFAAGGFTSYLRDAIDWKKVVPKIDMVNLMTYDLVSGFATTTGHHTPLYSTQQQSHSTDLAIHYLDSLKVPRNKLVIGAAFYGRMWGNVEPVNNGLYQAGQFKRGISYKNFSTMLSTDSGYVYYRDSIAFAPYIYHPARKEFVTYDDIESISEKTKYAIRNHLGGIMFWQLAEDTYENGLLEAIDRTIKKRL
jgi:chitinase